MTLSTLIQTAKSGHSPSIDVVGASQLGNDIRALRKSRGLTLIEFGEQLGRSVGFISQLERGISEPSISDLRKIAALFGVPISLFFGQNEGDPAEHGFIVRAGSRRKLGGEGSALVEELLSPDLGGSFEIIRSEFAPGAERTRLLTRDTQEAGYIVSGNLDLEIDGKWFELGPGDSFRFNAVPMRWRNKGSTKAVAIWVISPPVY
ncbi:MAG: XRE family transcriptional regulator [Rhizobiaceae bacterium]|nr:XRE family transcriptional regulator [Rhizobiaceae bacterium]